MASHSCSLSCVPKCSYEAEKERENMALYFDRYKDRVQLLPKEKGWASQDMYMFQGFWYRSMSRYPLQAIMVLQDIFIAHPTDIYLVTLPKSGTTWLKALLFAIVNREQYKNNSLLTHPLLLSNPHNCLPFLEHEVFRNTPTYVEAHSPRLFSTHIPYTSLPQSILESRCRLIYLCRNPKDVLVSTFHFFNNLRDKSLGEEMTFEEAFESFSKGVSPIGPFWDHVKGYHNVSSAHPGRVLFLTYEDMKRDTANHVKRLAQFIGYSFTEEEEVEGVVQEIVRLCRFENLSEVNKYGNLLEGIPNNTFFRKGEVGDWTNHFTNEMSQILDQITEEKFHGLEISFNLHS